VTLEKNEKILIKPLTSAFQSVILLLIN